MNKDFVRWARALGAIASGSYPSIGAALNGVEDTGHLCCVQIARTALGRCRFCNVTVHDGTCLACGRSDPTGNHSPFFTPWQGEETP